MDQLISTRIWLIRHGEPRQESHGRCYGRTDFGLSPQGRSQMESVAESLRNEPIEALYVSPLERAVESGEILARVQGVTVSVEDRLREMDFGEFEGKRYEEIKRDYPELYSQWMQTPTEIQFPGGESFLQMKARVIEAASEIYNHHRGQAIAMVAHGGVIRILLADSLGIPDANIFRIAQDYAATNLISLTGNYPTVELLNRRFSK